jgi:hypothetical protein
VNEASYQLLYELEVAIYDVAIQRSMVDILLERHIYVVNPKL